MIVYFRLSVANHIIEGIFKRFAFQRSRWSILPYLKTLYLGREKKKIVQIIINIYVMSNWRRAHWLEMFDSLWFSLHWLFIPMIEMKMLWIFCFVLFTRFKHGFMEIENESISYSNQTDQIHMKIDQIDYKKSWFNFSFANSSWQNRRREEKKRICLIQSIKQSHYDRRRINVAFDCKIFAIFVVRRLIEKCISGRQPMTVRLP